MHTVMPPENSINEDQGSNRREAFQRNVLAATDTEKLKSNLTRQISDKTIPRQGNTSSQHHHNSTHKRMILSTTNAAYVDFAENWLESIRRIGFKLNITVVAEDHDVYTHLLRRTDIHVMEADQLAQSEKLVFDSPEYKKFVNKRPQYILDFLLKGVDVLFTDVDTVLLDDPFQYFDEFSDIFIQEDQGPPNNTILCAGFVYYRSTNLTIQFVKRWIERMDYHNNTKPDQMLLNMILRKRGKLLKKLKVKILSREKFVSGKFYFNDSWRKNHTDRYVNPVMVHNNWIIGHDVKVERFKETGLWFLDDHVTTDRQMIGQLL